MQFIYLIIGTIISLILIIVKKAIKDNNKVVKKLIYKQAELIPFKKSKER